MNINNKEQLNKIKLCWGELLNWGSMQNLLNFDRKVRMRRNGLMTRWLITAAKNILHSRMRLNANERMDERVVGSSAHIVFKFVSKRRMLMQHFVGGTFGCSCTKLPKFKCPMYVMKQISHGDET